MPEKVQSSLTRAHCEYDVVAHRSSLETARVSPCAGAGVESLGFVPVSLTLSRAGSLPPRSSSTCGS